MVIQLKSLIIGAVIVATSAWSVQAAEILSEPKVVEAPAVEVFGGWYLRGDISSDYVESFDVTYAGNAFTRAEIDQGYNFGVGIGYQLNEYFRADLTVERFGSGFSGTTVGSCAFLGGIAIPGSCTSVESADFTAWSIGANAYVDLGNYGRFTPYAGAGLGISMVSWENYVSVDTCTRTNVATQSCYPVGTGSYVAPGAGATTTTRTTAYSGTDELRFSYSVMAGFSFDLTERLKLDAGYKFTSIVSGPIINNIGGGISIDHDAIGVHAVRLGLRYAIW